MLPGRVAASFPFLPLCGGVNEADKPEGESRHSSRGGDGHHPGPDDAGCDTPAHGREPVRSADADNGSGDGVGGGNRDARQRSGEQSDGTGGLSAEAADGSELGDAGAHGVYDAPSAKVGSESDRSMGGENDGPVVVSPTSGELRGSKDFGAVKCAGDDPHGLLSVVAAVAEAIGSGGKKLQAAEPGVNALWGFVAQDPEYRDHEGKAEDKPDDGGDDDKNEGFVPPGHDDDAPAGAQDGGAGHAADQSVRGGSRKAPPPGKEVPDDGAEESGDDDILGNKINADHAAADSLGHGGSEQKGSDEVKEGGPDHGQPGRKDAGGNDGGDAVGGVVESIEEVEGQGDQEGDDQEQELRFHEVCLSAKARDLRTLQNYGFQHVGYIFRFVGCEFEELDQLFALEQGNGILLLIEELANGGARDHVGFVFEA